MSTLKVNTLEEATSGGATFYTAKAWVNLNGTGTVAIRADGNVSSITDVSTGQYDTNFSSAMSDINYSCAIGTYLADVGVPTPFIFILSTTSVRLYSYREDTNVYADTSTFCANIIR